MRSSGQREDDNSEGETLTCGGRNGLRSCSSVARGEGGHEVSILTLCR
jgi:hypothetical protein